MLCLVVKVQVHGLGFQKRTQLEISGSIYNTVPEQFNPNIRVCVAQFTEDYFLMLGESSLQCRLAQRLFL